MDIRGFWICFDSAGPTGRPAEAWAPVIQRAWDPVRGLTNGRGRAGLRCRKTAELPGNGEVKSVSRDPLWDLGCSAYGTGDCRGGGLWTSGLFTRTGQVIQPAVPTTCW